MHRKPNKQRQESTTGTLEFRLLSRLRAREPLCLLHFLRTHGKRPRSETTKKRRKRHTPTTTATTKRYIYTHTYIHKRSTKANNSLVRFQDPLWRPAASTFSQAIVRFVVGKTCSRIHATNLRWCVNPMKAALDIATVLWQRGEEQRGARLTSSAEICSFRLPPWSKLSSSWAAELSARLPGRNARQCGGFSCVSCGAEPHAEMFRGARADHGAVSKFIRSSPKARRSLQI